MKLSQHAALWVAIAVTALVLLVLLRHILLPFVVGMALAYLLAPIVSTLERRGINRAFATLTLSCCWSSASSRSSSSCSRSSEARWQPSSKPSPAMSRAFRRSGRCEPAVAQQDHGT